MGYGIDGVSIDGSGELQPLVEKLVQEAELAGIWKDLGRMEIFEHAVKSVGIGRTFRRRLEVPNSCLGGRIPPRK